MSHLIKTKITPAVIKKPLKTTNKVLALTSAAIISIAGANAFAQNTRTDFFKHQQVSLNQKINSTEDSILSQQNITLSNSLTPQNTRKKDEKALVANEKTKINTNKENTAAEKKKNAFQFSKKTKISAGFGLAGIYTLILSTYIGTIIHKDIFNTKITKTQIGTNIAGGALLGASIANSPLIGAGLSIIATCCYHIGRSMSTSLVPQKKK